MFAPITQSIRQLQEHSHYSDITVRYIKSAQKTGKDKILEVQQPAVIVMRIAKDVCSNGRMSKSF